MLTIPMIGWVAKLGSNRSKLASFSIAKYGAQTGNDWQWFPDAGNGIRDVNGQNVTGNDPNDANVAVRLDASSKAGCSTSSARWGTNANGGLAVLHPRQRAEHLALDASRRASDRRDDGRDPEQDDRLRDQDQGSRSRRRWSSVRRSGAGAAISTAATTSSTAASTAGARCPIATRTAARTTCPGCSTRCDRTTSTAGQRLLDVFTVHYYPQGGEFSDDTSHGDAAAAQPLDALAVGSELRRRDLDQRQGQLIPRLKSWVNTLLSRARRSASPSTTGARRATSTAPPRRPTSTASSAAKGSTWRARWTTPDPTTPTYKAMKMYRNYDGNKSTFGDTSVLRRRCRTRTTSRRSRRTRSSDGALTVMVISKYLSGTRPSRSIWRTSQRWDSTGLAADLGQRHHPSFRRQFQR